MLRSIFVLAALSCLSWKVASSQTDSSGYSVRSNTFSAFAEYSNDSSHIFLGTSANRKIGGIGATYARRLWSNPVFSWQYLVEVRPILVESDPIETQTITPLGIATPTNSNFSEPVGSCHALQQQVNYVDPISGIHYNYLVTDTCSRRATYMGGLSPLGEKFNFLPRKRLEPFVIGNAGFVVSTRDIPSDYSSSFNFTFEFGAGLEWFYGHGRSVMLEYRLHHLSNDYIGANNPGIDSGVFKATYSFGR